MPKKNKFSIVVAVYNRPEEMYELLDSIVNQEFKDLEIIVVDDGSEKSSREVVDSFKKNIGDKRSKAVLEIRCHETPFILEDGQIIGKLIYEQLSNEPNAMYGEIIGSNYQGQTLKLSKHFENWQ